MLEIINKIIRVEGAYSDLKNDSGGRTMYGITEAVARSNGYYGEMERLPKNLAIQIYSDSYWSPMRLDDIIKISYILSEKLLDCSINIGVKRSSEFLQRSINLLNKRGSLYDDVSVDGILGNETINALNLYFKKRGNKGIEVLLKMINCFQGMHYIELTEKRSKDEDFIYGWFSNRVD